MRKPSGRQFLTNFPDVVKLFENCENVFDFFMLLHKAGQHFPNNECEWRRCVDPSDFPPGPERVNMDGLVNKSEYEEVGSRSFCESSWLRGHFGTGGRQLHGAPPIIANLRQLLCPLNIYWIWIISNFAWTFLPYCRFGQAPDRFYVHWGIS